MRARTAAGQRDRVRSDLGPPERRTGIPSAGSGSSIGRSPVCSTAVREDDLVIFTADHGNDPTTPSTDHSREVVPLLVSGPGCGRSDLGRRGRLPISARPWPSFSGYPPLAAGTSFLSEVWLD